MTRKQVSSYIAINIEISSLHLKALQDIKNYTNVISLLIIYYVWLLVYYSLAKITKPTDIKRTFF